MNKKILILGADGMLGHRVYKEFKEVKEFDVFGTIRGDKLPKAGDLFKNWSTLYGAIDAMEPLRVLHIIEAIKPDFVINCIGIIKQREEQAHDPVQMIQINALLPRLINNLLKKIGGQLITFSSDCVFLGDHDRCNPRTEDDHPDAYSLYGKTKYLGEVTDKALTLRTSFIGFEIKGFTSLLEWFFRAVKEQEAGKTPIYVRSIQGYDKAIWSGVSTRYLANWLVRYTSRLVGISGVQQLTAKTITKYELLELINKEFKLGASIVKSDKFELDKICNREMSGEKLSKITGEKIPSWDLLVHGLKEDWEWYKTWRE